MENTNETHDWLAEAEAAFAANRWSDSETTISAEQLAEAEAPRKRSCFLDTLAEAVERFGLES